jgi:hypothetical protein
MEILLGSMERVEEVFVPDTVMRSDTHAPPAEHTSTDDVPEATP